MSYKSTTLMPQLLALGFAVRRHSALADRHEAHTPLAVQPRLIVAAYATTTATYDPLDRLTAAVDAANIASSTSYDALGRVRSVTDADRGVSTRQYDAAGNLTQTTDAKNQVIGYGYDALDRLVAQSGGVTATNNYDGDAAYPADTNTRGHLVTAISGPVSARLSTVHATFDARGRTTTTVETIGTNARAR